MSKAGSNEDLTDFVRRIRERRMQKEWQQVAA